MAMIDVRIVVGKLRNAGPYAVLCLTALLLGGCGARPDTEPRGIAPLDRTANVEGTTPVTRKPMVASSDSATLAIVPQNRLASASDLLPEYACPDEAALWSEYIHYLENNFQRLDALRSRGLPGGEQEKWAVAGSHLWLARAQKEFAENDREQATTSMAKAVAFSKQAIEAVTGAYEVSTATQMDVLQAARLQLVTGRAFLILKKCQDEQRSKGS
jgi:hypothetical protein